MQCRFNSLFPIVQFVFVPLVRCKTEPEETSWNDPLNDVSRRLFRFRTGEKIQNPYVYFKAWVRGEEGVFVDLTSIINNSLAAEVAAVPMRGVDYAG